MTFKLNFERYSPAQVNDLIMLTNKPNISVMEIGFNCAEIFLQNNKELTVTSFDLGGGINLNYIHIF